MSSDFKDFVDYLAEDRGAEVLGELTLDQWIKLAKQIKANKVSRKDLSHHQLIARIQIMLTNAGLINDEGFVSRLQR